MAVVWVRWGNLRSSAPPAPQVRLVRSPAGRPLVPQQWFPCQSEGPLGCHVTPFYWTMTFRSARLDGAGGSRKRHQWPWRGDTGHGNAPERSRSASSGRKCWRRKGSDGRQSRLRAAVRSSSPVSSDWAAGLALLPLLRGLEFRRSPWQGPS